MTAPPLGHTFAPQTAMPEFCAVELSDPHGRTYWCAEHRDDHDVTLPPPEPAPRRGRPGAATVCLADVRPERVEWLWPGRLPLGKVIVLDGDPGLGKSTLALDWAARVSAGRAWPDGSPCPRGAVLLLSAEDGLADTVRPRLDAAGADPARIHALIDVPTAGTDGQVEQVPPQLPRDVPHLEQVVTEHGVRLVVLDVLMAYLGGGTNSYRDQDVRAALTPLVAMADRTGCCVVMLRHLRKGGGDALTAGGGSIGIIGAVRGGMTVGRDPDDEDGRILAVSKMNLARHPDSLGWRLIDTDAGVARVEYTGPRHGVTADDLTRRDPGGTESDEDRDAIVTALRDLLDGNGGSIDAKTGEAAMARLGYSPKQVRAARKRAGIESVKAGYSGGWVWRRRPDAQPPGGALPGWVDPDTPPVTGAGPYGPGSP
jgi:hypothetical protein